MLQGLGSTVVTSSEWDFFYRQESACAGNNNPTFVSLLWWTQCLLLVAPVFSGAVYI